MTEIKEKIKKLLKKAKEQGDIDMVDLAMELLDEIPVPEVEFQDEARALNDLPEYVKTGQFPEVELPEVELPESPKIKEVLKKSKPSSKFEEFSMNKTNTEKRSREPLVVKKRPNKFIDDGSLHDDIQTPETTLNERRRKPFKKVSQKCGICSNSVEVHPQFAREFFKCDKCMRK